MLGSMPPPRQAALRKVRDPADGSLLDDALVLRFDGPASATGEDVVELHCHGGRAVGEAVLAALDSIPGLRRARPGEFTHRAFENGRIDLTEAEGLADLIEAETESQRKAALLMADGALKRQIEDWRSRVVDLSARAEAAIDYDEDGDVGPDPVLASDCAELAEELSEWLRKPRAEALKDGVTVVLAGPPNAGKSSLLNALTGVDKAIVTDIPGTTRDQIEVPVSFGGTPFVLIDTAGIRDTDQTVEAIGVERARRSALGCDILLWLGERNDAPRHPRTVFVHSRSDLEDRASVPDGSVAVSSKTGFGTSDLLLEVMRQARELLPAEGAIALNGRQASHLEDARDALRRPETDIVLMAEQLRAARMAFERLSGRATVEDVFDALFGRFCLGK